MTDGSDRLCAAYRGRLGAFSFDVALDVPLHGVTGVFGPSGSGKTVLLRSIAGLGPLRGRLVVGGERWEDADAGIRRPTHQRPIGYVFQEPSLFSHLSVRENLVYGERRASHASPAAVGLDDVVALLGIETLLDRDPARLSGGERQRVALGRALLSAPRLLLMDEPLAALDRTARDEILPYLERLQRTLTVPILYVTHDLDEIERLSDHIVLLAAGRVVASGPLADVLADPVSPLARGRAASTVLDATVTSVDVEDGMVTFDVGGVDILLPGGGARVGGRARLRIAAHDVSLALDRPARTTILNVLSARIVRIEPLPGGQANVLLVLGEPPGGARILARITQRSLRVLGLSDGDRVFAQIKGVSIADARGARAE